MFSDGIIGTNDDDDADDDDEEVKEGKTKIETSVRYLETKRLKVWGCKEWKKDGKVCEKELVR